MADSREIEINIVKGSSLVDFRKLISNKTTTKALDVNNAVRLYSDEGFSVATHTDVGKPYGVFTKMLGGMAGAGKAAKYASKVITGGKALSETQGGGSSWAPWLGNIRAFKNSGPIKAQITLKFHMGEFGLWDAKEEVFKPIVNLMTMFLPLGINGININSHFMTSTQILWEFIQQLGEGFDISDILGDVSFSSSSGGGTVPGTPSASHRPSPGSVDAPQVSKGVSLTSALGGASQLIDNLSTGMNRIVVNTINEASSSAPYNVNIGYADQKFKLTKLQPVDCTVKFSNKEYDDNGYPAIGEIVMHFQSYQPGTLSGIGADGTINFGFLE